MIMKSLNITLLLAVLTAVFVLTVSGVSKEENVIDKYANISDKVDTNLLVHNKAKIKRPNN